MRVWAKVFGAGVLLVFAATAGGQERAAIPSGAAAGTHSVGVATVTFQFERPGLAVPRFRMVVREDGTGRYEADEVLTGAQAGEAQSVAAGPSAHVEREIALTPATTAKILKTARSERYFQSACASKAKNIADTGVKMLSYEGRDGRGSCTYNYTENKGIAMLTELFQGVATTLDEGRKLEFKRRYDRLGLDAELDVLTQASESGRALELGTITPLLEKLASDTEMMQRVRLRSAKLLDRAADGR